MREIIEKTIDFVKLKLRYAEGGHDWSHTERVWINTRNIARYENVDELVVELAALLHDIADSKFHDGNEEIGPRMAHEFLEREGVEKTKAEHVVNIIRHMSFKNSFDTEVFCTRELEVVQDADRLDAIGAIGIARAFHYGGFKNRAIFDPEIRPQLIMTKEEYKNSAAPTINHFYEKLLLLKDKMNTDIGKKMAQERHDFMVAYLDQFFREAGIESWS